MLAAKLPSIIGCTEAGMKLIVAAASIQVNTSNLHYNGGLSTLFCQICASNNGTAVR